VTDHVQMADGEFSPTLPWPFPGDVFPQDLGAVVMRTVLSGKAPALQVIHTEDGHWGIADGLGNPNRNLEATHIWHVVGMDRTLAELATLPPGRQADRNSVGEPWVISPLVYAAPTRWRRLRERLASVRRR
jgi:hypothetical protein